MEGHVITCDHAEEQPRSQGLSSSRPLEREGAGRRETLGTRLAEERESVALSGRVSFRDFPTDDGDIEEI